MQITRKHTCDWVYNQACRLFIVSILYPTLLSKAVNLLMVHTVDSEIFARVLFSRNFAYAKFRENQTLANWGYDSVVF